MPPPPGPPAGPPGPAGLPGRLSVVVASGRALELAASVETLRRGRSATLRGVLEAFANPAGGARGQRLEVQQRTGSNPAYRTLRRVSSGRSGRFALRVRPRRTTFYRARVAQTASCLGAISNRERVGVTVPRRRGR